MFLLFLSAGLVYIFTKTIYRLYLHPLASFPGPKLAASTSLFNAYHDILGTGYVKLFPALHAKYGPIIRIQPNELHIEGLEAYNQIHRVSTPFARIWHNNPFLTGSLQSLTTLPATSKRRAYISPFFSRSAISRAEPTLHGPKLSKFLAQLARADGSVVNFFLAFRCLTADVVMNYCFQNDLDALAHPEFRNRTLERMVDGMDMAVTSTFFPNLFGVLNAVIFALPERAREKWFAPIYGFQTMQSLARERVEEAWKQRGQAKDQGSGEHMTMFDAMCNPDTGKGQVGVEKEDMVADGCLMIAAGTDTGANALGRILWHVTQDKEIEGQLLKELRKSMGKDDVVPSATLDGEGFEYMRAVVKEGLRLSYGVPGRMMRKVPEGGAKFGDTWVPGGQAIVNTCIYMNNTNPEVFPDPFRFDPERWICDAETYLLRDKHMVSFSRGSRGCIGQNLALALLHLTVAHLFRRFEITTTGYTTERDMEWKDCFVPSCFGRIKGRVEIRSE
ncbi:cytochrome P450 [Phaeosphaeria sp. MPI-PUGE-AT-0046c]|nr:cytochrome P450 [Phaeosphaeria sp. MPI-PUGE-AT-0046c]